MRKVLRIAGILTAGIVMIFVMAVLGLRFYYSDFRLKSIMENSMSAELESRVTIGELETAGWMSLRLGQISFYPKNADSAWLRIDRIYADLDPWEIISKKVRFREISIAGGFLDYGMIPVFDSTVIVEEGTDDLTALPLNVIVDSFTLDDFKISGPEIDFRLNLEFADIDVRGIDDYSFTYKIYTDSGQIHYVSDQLSAYSNFVFSAVGSLSDSVFSRQRIGINLEDLKIAFPEEYILGDVEVFGLATINPESRDIVIDSIGFSLNDRQIINFKGDIELSPRLKLGLDCSGTVWQVADFADLANRVKIPLKPTGDILLSEGRLLYTSSGVMYDFTLDIFDLGLEFGDELKISGINGQVFSDGDMRQIIFGSSITIDSLVVISPDGSSVRLKGISSAVEAEVSESDYSLNITSGIADFLGGRLDLSAFSENSRVSGELLVSDMNLAQVSSGGNGQADTTVFGLLDLTVDIDGVFDSISVALRADAENVTVIALEDTLRLGDQGLAINSVTILSGENVITTIDYTIGPLITGNGKLEYPLGKGSEDSLVISYDMKVDNSLLPSYFPSSLARAIGDIDISGMSNLTGRLASLPDSIALKGRIDLSIQPTDLLVEDFRGLLFQLVSVSEIEIAPEGTAVVFRGDIGELYAEEYSDLPFSDVRFQGEIVSETDSVWKVTSFTAEIPSLNTTVTAHGEFGVADGIDYSDFNLRIDFKSEDPVALNSLISMKGNVVTEAAIKQSGEILEFAGSVKLSDVALTGVNDFYCGGLNGDIPYSGKINLSDSLFIKKTGKATINKSTYRRNKRAAKRSGYGTVGTEIIAFGDIALMNMEIDLLFGDGILDIPSISGEFLGGDLAGNMRLDFTDVNILREYPDYENIEYSLSLETANLDFNQLVYGFGPHANKANLTSAAYFRGRGIMAPGEDYDIEGRFHISRMGPEVIDRILDFIDPENQNPGVAQTRSLLNKKLFGFIDVSYKPKELIVEIKHNSLYPGLYMSQPFYANLIPLMRIPMPIRYGRIPLDVILSGTEENR